jgi:predicted metal-dependent peptidase
MIDTNKFEATVIDLIKKEPFYACLIQNMRRFYTDKVPTIGVNIENGGVNIYINPKFFNAAGDLQAIDYLKHECGHITGDHFKRAEAVNSKAYDKTFNMAAEIAINQMLPNIPNELEMNGQKGQTATLANLQKQFPEALPNQASEYYYAFLKQKQDEMKQNGQGDMQTIDDHSIWKDGEVNQEVIDQIRENVLKKASEQAEKIRAGSTPNDVKLEIDKLLNSKVNWKSQLQRFVANTTEVLIESTRKRRHRKYGVYQPGNKIFPKVHLAVVIDTSGSTFGPPLEQFLSEIQHIYKSGAEMTILTCDTQVHDIEKFNPKKKVNIRGGGGTCYQPALDACEKLDVDGIIFFGDMETFDSNDLKKPRVPILWAIMGHSEKPAPWGFEIRIK